MTQTRTSDSRPRRQHRHLTPRPRSLPVGVAAGYGDAAPSSRIAEPSPVYEAVRCGGLAWRVHRDWKDVLLDGDGLRLAAWLACGQAQVVKSRPHRTVYRVELPQGSFYLKHYRALRFGHRLRDALRGSPARREWQRAFLLADRGIPTPMPLAIGEPPVRDLGRDCYLLTLAVEHAEPLDRHLATYYSAPSTLYSVLSTEPLSTHRSTLLAASHAKQRRLLAEALARFAAAMHHAGVEHADLHPGNVLICRKSASSAVPHSASKNPPLEPPNLWLVDLQAVSIRKRLFGRHSAAIPSSLCGGGKGGGATAIDQPKPSPAPSRTRSLVWLRSLCNATLGWRASRRNLVVLNMYFSQHASRSDRHRFWREYLRCRPGLVPYAREAARQIEARTAVACSQLWRRRDRRCQRTGKYFYFRMLRASAGYASRKLPEAVFETLLRDPDTPLRQSSTQVLKRSTGSLVARIELPGAGSKACRIYKRWIARGLDRLRSWFRPGHARRAWRAGHALLQRGVPTPLPLALIERHNLLGGRCSYVLWEEVTGGLNLHEYVARILAARSDTAGAAAEASELTRRSRQRKKSDARNEIRRAIRQLALLLRRLHDRGFDHRDLKAANILTSCLPRVTKTTPSWRGGDKPRGIPYLLSLREARGPSPHQPFNAKTPHRSETPVPGSTVGKTSLCVVTSESPQFFLLDLDCVVHRRRMSARRRQRNLARLLVSFYESPLITRADKLRFLNDYLPGGLARHPDWKAWCRTLDQLAWRKIQRNRARGRVVK